ncbi:hypothetical protein CKF54_01050 [Psittacicella hinzii]|uniref:Solute-binding protein family 5 domain-containing protein n=1 Tax=Psittacicella hinzii TaxID=2028575 RepID=A0A3A1YAA4_9GAMM|nr:ABC transporter substrate-binding protein [Psittacicella hinzii]RIY34266.1 hypothetical protein CKF54_01050 [Psittacicella hinzii]
MIKKFIFLASALALGACGQENTAHQDHKASPSHQDLNHTRTLQVTAQWEINSLDPAKVGYIFYAMQLAENLVETNPAGELVPGLAVKWEANKDASVWTFTLRDGVKFHDLTSLNAQAVKNSLEVALSKPTLLANAHIEEIKVIDEHTLEFHLHRGLESFPAFLAHSSAIILSPAAYNESKEVTAIIGTGPYKVKEIEPPQKLTAQYFKEYWGDQAIIHNVSYLANSRVETRTILVQSDPSYLVYNLDYASAQRLRLNSRVVVASKPIARTIQIKLNLAHPLLAQNELRHVLSEAIDRTAIAEQLLGINQGQAYQLLPPAYSQWQDTHAHAKEINYQVLQNKLADLGWKLNANQQLVNAQGQEFVLNLRTFPDRAELPLIATALQDQWQKLGIKVNILIGNSSEIASGHQDGSLEMALYSRNYGSLPDPTGILRQDFKVGGSDWGTMNWQGAGKFIDMLNNHEKPEVLIKYLNDELPIIPVVYALSNVAHSRELGGLELDPFERTYYLNKLYWIQDASNKQEPTK